MREELLKLGVIEYKKFSEKIINTNYSMIGIKTETLKKIAKQNINNYKEYFKDNHLYYEEYMIHGFMLGYLKIPFNELFVYIEEYINYVDCWSMVDSIVSNLKIIKKHKDETFVIAKKYISSNDEFRIRFGYCILLSYYINTGDENKINEILTLCNKKHSLYYVQMMVAWLLSVAYVKFKEKVLNFLKDNNLDDFTYNKTISKICDSLRVNKEEKIFLKEMRRK